MYLVCYEFQYFIYYGISSFPRIRNGYSAEVCVLVGHYSLRRQANSTSIALSLQPPSIYFCRSMRSIFSCWILLAFSVHERGSRTAIWSFAIMSGATLSIMSALVLSILLLTAVVIGGLYSTVMWYRICHGKWGFGLLPYHWEFASSLYSFLFRRCVNQFLSVIWLW